MPLSTVSQWRTVMATASRISASLAPEMLGPSWCVHSYSKRRDLCDCHADGTHCQASNDAPLSSTPRASAPRQKRARDESREEAFEALATADEVVPRKRTPVKSILIAPL